MLLGPLPWTGNMFAETLPCRQRSRFGNSLSADLPLCGLDKALPSLPWFEPIAQGALIGWTPCQLGSMDCEAKLDRLVAV
jgi:hypothetical protein